jgi:hypothetical protein
MGYRTKSHRGTAVLAVALAWGAIAGCGGGVSEGPAVTARADAVEVTYYYLPG